MHITEALIEQAKYFKTLHDTNPPVQTAAKLQYSNMLTLTKGEKLQSLLENFNKQRHKEPMTNAGQASPMAANNVVNNKTATAGINSLPLVKLFEKLDNNNVPDEQLSPPPTPDMKHSKIDKIELNIVEQEQGQPKQSEQQQQPDTGQSISEDISCSSGIGPDASLSRSESNVEVIDSARTSVSTMSLDSDKYSDVDAAISPQHHQTQPILDNNNSIDDGNEVIVTPTEESIGSTATAASIEKRTKIIEGIEEATEATIDAQLDINENKTNESDDAVKTEDANASIENVMDDNDVNVNTKSAEAEAETAVLNAEHTNDSTTTKLDVNDLDEKVQIVDGDAENALKDIEKNKENEITGNDGPTTAVTTTTTKTSSPVKPIEMIASTPIEVHSNYGNNVDHDNDDEDNMSPLLNTRQPLNSPRLIKSKDMLGDLPLTPDSSHSLDSSCEFSTPFELKPFHSSHIPERSFSSESLNSEASVDSNDSKSSIKLTEAKFSKNGTLERQTSYGAPVQTPSTTTATGLQVLMLWNNHITRSSSQYMSDLLANTTTLEILNVGRNVLSNEFITNIKGSLKTNTSLTSLGMQSSHLNSEGVKTLAEVLDFGGNTTLQRIDLRDNNLQVCGLTALNEVLKSNKSVTRIDLDDVPRRHHVSIFSDYFS